MSSNVFTGKDEQWYSQVMVGYIVGASALSAVLVGIMALGGA